MKKTTRKRAAARTKNPARQVIRKIDVDDDGFEFFTKLRTRQTIATEEKIAVSTTRVLVGDPLRKKLKTKEGDYIGFGRFDNRLYVGLSPRLVGGYRMHKQSMYKDTQPPGLIANLPKSYTAKTAGVYEMDAEAPLVDRGGVMFYPLKKTE